jgi:hypothetical protein
VLITPPQEGKAVGTTEASSETKDIICKTPRH